MNFSTFDKDEEINVSILPILEDQAIVDDPKNTTSIYNGLVIGLFALGCVSVAILVKIICEFTIKNRDNEQSHSSDLIRVSSKTSRASGVSSILELAEANSLIPPVPEPDIFFGLRITLTDVDVNRLHFPGHNGEYSFNMNDLNFMGVIETTEENVIKKYHHKPSKRDMAVKFNRIPLSKTEIFDLNSYVALLKREILAVKIISTCSNIVNFYGVAMLDGEILFCMELMDWSLKELYTKIHKEKNVFPEELLGYVVVASLDALIFCKAHGIVQFDVKPTTILVNRRGNIKLGDFAGSRVHDAPLSTWIYWPPEIFLNFNSNCQEHISVWSLGLSLLEVLLGKLPFSHFHSTNSPNSKFLPEFIIKTDYEAIINNNIKGVTSTNFCEFLRACLSEVDKRPQVEKLINFTFYRLYTQTFSKEIVARLLCKCFVNFYKVDQKSALL